MPLTVYRVNRERAAGLPGLPWRPLKIAVNRAVICPPSDVSPRAVGLKKGGFLCDSRIGLTFWDFPSITLGRPAQGQTARGSLGLTHVVVDTRFVTPEWQTKMGSQDGALTSFTLDSVFNPV